MANIFSKSVLSGISNNMSSDFRQAIVGTIPMKKEIKKVLQRANRRAQNIENAGLPSPALKALYAERGSNAGVGVYSKFSITGLDIGNETEWALIKQEYGRALAFLNNPTSSATGARQYVKSVANDYTGGNFESAKRLIDVATSPEIAENGEISVFNYGSILENFASDVMQAEETAQGETIDHAQAVENVLARLEREVTPSGQYSAGAKSDFYKLFGNGSPRMK